MSSGPALAATLLVLAAPSGPPEAALLVTQPGAGRTTLHFQRVGEGPSPAVATFVHQPDAVVRGAVLPGTREVLATALTVPSRDVTYASTLVRVAPQEPPRSLCDRVYYATRPLVTATGRVFVQRGRAGFEPSPEQARAGLLRVDELTVDEVNPRTGQTRVVRAFEGYIAFLIGESTGELLVYFVRPGGAQLVAVNADSGAARLLADLAPFARDFVVDSARRAVVYTQLDEALGAWTIERLDLTSLARERLGEGPTPALAPFPWPGDAAVVFFSEGRLRRRGRPVTEALGEGVSHLLGTSLDGQWAYGRHARPGQSDLPFALHFLSGRVTPLWAPGDAAVGVAGWVSP